MSASSTTGGEASVPEARSSAAPGADGDGPASRAPDPIDDQDSAHPREAAGRDTDRKRAGGRPTSDSVIQLLLERVQSTVAVGTDTMRLAAAEARLAATSAAVVLVLALLGVAVAFTCWLLIVALLGVGLHALGLAIGWTLVVLLACHVVVAAGLGLAIARLLRHTGFRRTREAITRRRALLGDPGDATDRASRSMHTRAGAR